MAREKMPEFKRKGNWKNAPGSQAATKKSRGVATTEAVKKMKQKESTAPKPKAKPAKPSATSGASRSTAGKVSAKSGASRSVMGKVAPKKPQSRSGSMILGQGRNSPAAQKLKRTVGYGR